MQSKVRIYMLQLIILLTISFPTQGFSEISSNFLKKMENTPLIVNIDNPNFRKLVVAVPNFLIENKSQDSATAKEFSAYASKELVGYLQYSGLFNVISSVAYNKLLKNLEKNFKTSTGVLKDPSKLKVDGIDMTQWKSIGIESLVVAKVEEEEPGNLLLRYYVYDILRSKRVLAKQLRGIVKGEYTKAIRKVANRIMEIYTGKKGIFESKIAFIGKRSKFSKKQVFICDFDGSNLEQITHTDSLHVSPHWSNDNRFLTFTSYERGNPDLYVYEIATRKKRLLSSKQGLNSGGQWAPGDKIIAFTGSVKGDANIYTITVDGRNRRKFISGHGLDVDPVFSPNRKMLAFVSGRYGNPHVFIGDLEWNSSGEPKVIRDRRLTYAGWYNSTPDWSPDSDKIIFAGYDKDINRYDVFIVNPDGTQMERLTLKTGDNESPSWAPNGQMIAFQSNRIGTKNIKGRPGIFIMNRDGSAQRKLKLGLYEAQTPDWSPSGY